MEIPGYRIDREIGRGGMATVYLATQESLGRPVVLKIMNTGRVDTPEYAKRFLIEGQIVAALNDPNIITIFDIGIADDDLYISMEHLGGGDLTGRIAEGMTPVQALEVMVQVAHALDVAHQHDVIHRDVKPANILFRNDNTPVLTDFGIAKMTTMDAELTSTGIVLGSPFYMSPEQAEGKEIDGRSDIYSLGIIFYEMLTGERPFKGDNALKIVLGHLQKPIPTLPAERAEFQPLVNRMLAKEPGDRFESAAALIDFLTAVQEPKARRKVIKMDTDSAAMNTPAPASDRHFDEGTAALTRASRARRKRQFKLLMALAVTVTLTAGGMVGYYVGEINRYSNVANRGPGGAMGPAVGMQEGGIGLPNAAAATGVNLSPQQAQLRPQLATALVWLGRKAIKEGRFISPPNDNAHYYFTRLLLIDPDHKDARQGMSELATAFASKAEREMKKKDFAEAERTIHQGLNVDPTNKKLLVLQSNLQLRERSFLDGVMGLFKPQGGPGI